MASVMAWRWWRGPGACFGCNYGGTYVLAAAQSSIILRVKPPAKEWLIARENESESLLNGIIDVPRL